MIPVIRALQQMDGVTCNILNTGQHLEMVNDLERTFNITPDWRFEIMKSTQGLNDILAVIMQKVIALFRKYRPDIVVLQGDTTTVLSVGLACFHEQITVAHVEAGLRSGNIFSPFPEEFNRRSVSSFANYNFAPTQQAAANLREEGVDDRSIWITGNTVLDAVKYFHEGGLIDDVAQSNRRQILVTAHRRENLKFGISSICKAITQIIDEFSDIHFLWPLHPNPLIKDAVKEQLSDNQRVSLVDPLDYKDLLTAISASYIVWTDSGGIQEEAPSFSKPILVLRNETERPEVIESGFGTLVSTDVKRIVAETRILLHSSDEYQKRVSAPNPFGDGKAGQRIAEILAHHS